eukprot:754525-Pyramimonas_sp.AAC.1
MGLRGAISSEAASCRRKRWTLEGSRARGPSSRVRGPWSRVGGLEGSGLGSCRFVPVAAGPRYRLLCINLCTDSYQFVR